jgi:hypothetical protein
MGARPAPESLGKPSRITVFRRLGNTKRRGKFRKKSRATGAREQIHREGGGDNGKVSSIFVALQIKKAASGRRLFLSAVLCY